MYIIDCNINDDNFMIIKCNWFFRLRIDLKEKTFYDWFLTTFIQSDHDEIGWKRVAIGKIEMQGPIEAS